MTWNRTSTVDDVPVDPYGDAVASAVSDMLAAAVVEVVYSPTDGAEAPEHEPPWPAGTASATAPGPPGWQTTLCVRLDERVARLVSTVGRSTYLAELLDVLPKAGLAAVEPFRRPGRAPQRGAVGPAMRRALRDTVAAEVLGAYLDRRVGGSVTTGLVADTIDFLIELSGTRVESHDLTHGVVVADVLHDAPRLDFAYPADVRTAKRAPLLFDGRRSVLLVDPRGRARTELQRHRFQRLVPGADLADTGDDHAFGGGSLVAEATRLFGGVGFLVRDDRSIWTFVDGRPLLVRRGEHWTAFPLELAASIENMIGGGSVAALVTQAAFTISGQPAGAILAIVDDPARLDGVVPLKDRYDLRNEIDPSAMRTETRLHHLIDAEELDAPTLVRLATLDGATVLDREGRLVAYGAVVTSADSQHEGARTAAARTLSETAEVVLKVSVDGDITVFRRGAVVTTLLGRTTS
ncbi:MAG: hypothetical protein AVDCRST_MAG50-2009 [uncultured Acidimicrobiales bacterium]|uniref:DAC domain-containing protein n=1 Tax=uncultured Acidimicrobiales bacterium TaxID=310071 RepID=A0A6J4IBD7_9ACTN|nr:MAG: hypothetical protein AVDCRST_MAG50-2009 [uncultured Acidimicrobiales bacterium]